MKIKEALKKPCCLYWWNCGRKILDFKGELGELLKRKKITFTKRKADIEGFFVFRFKNPYGITFTARGLEEEFVYLARIFIQMELARMGDKAQLTIYTAGYMPSKISVNFAR